MGTVFLPEKVRGEKTDLLLLSVLVLLVGFGAAVLFSASYFKAEHLTGSSYYGCCELAGPKSATTDPLLRCGRLQALLRRTVSGASVSES